MNKVDIYILSLEEVVMIHETPFPIADLIGKTFRECSCATPIGSAEKFCAICGEKNPIFDSDEYRRVFSESLEDSMNSTCHAGFHEHFLNVLIFEDPILQRCPFCMKCGARVIPKGFILPENPDQQH